MKSSSEEAKSSSEAAVEALKVEKKKLEKELEKEKTYFNKQVWIQFQQLIPNLHYFFSHYFTETIRN